MRILKYRCIGGLFWSVQVFWQRMHLKTWFIFIGFCTIQNFGFFPIFLLDPNWKHFFQLILYRRRLNGFAVRLGPFFRIGANQAGRFNKSRAAEWRNAQLAGVALTLGGGASGRKKLIGRKTRERLPGVRTDGRGGTRARTNRDPRTYIERNSQSRSLCSPLGDAFIKKSTHGAEKENARRCNNAALCVCLSHWYAR